MGCLFVLPFLGAAFVLLSVLALWLGRTLDVLAVVLGVCQIVLSGFLTNRSWRQYGIPVDMRKFTAGTGIVPRWISVVNLMGWGLAAAGLLRLLM